MQASSLPLGRLRGSSAAEVPPACHFVAYQSCVRLLSRSQVKRTAAAQRPTKPAPGGTVLLLPPGWWASTWTERTCWTARQADVYVVQCCLPQLPCTHFPGCCT